MTLKQIQPLTKIKIKLTILMIKKQIIKILKIIVIQVILIYQS